MRHHHPNDMMFFEHVNDMENPVDMLTQALPKITLKPSDSPSECA
jgi:hypothetical protein